MTNGQAAPDDGYESAFETFQSKPKTVFTPGIIPGLGVAKDIYIRHHNFWHRGEIILLITYTNEDIRNEEVEIVMGQAEKMLNGGN